MLSGFDDPGCRRRDGGKTAPQAAVSWPVPAGANAAESGVETRGPAGEWGDEPVCEVSSVCLPGLARTVVRRVGQQHVLT